MSNLISISSLSKEFGISTRTLRHYEDVGLLASVRLPDKQQRYYDEAAMARIHQIRILRKMEIPIKDIIKIYQNAETADIIEVFTRKITSIDENIATLTELRTIVEEFKQELLNRGISSVGDLPALIEFAAENKSVVTQDDKPSDKNNIERLLEVAEKRGRQALNIRVIEMRPMRVLSTYLKGANRMNTVDGDDEACEAYDAAHKRLAGEGYKTYHAEEFEGHSNHNNTYVLTSRIPDDAVNDTPYEDYILEGMFIAEATRPDVDPGELWEAMTAALNASEIWEIDDIANGGSRDTIYGCNGGLIDGAFAYWECFMPVRKKSEHSATDETVPYNKA